MTLLMFNATGRPVPADVSDFEIWLAVHNESKSGKAWLVSTTGQRRDACWLPKSMCDLGESVGGFQRFDHEGAPFQIPVHAVSMPRFIAVQKGFAK